MQLVRLSFLRQLFWEVIEDSHKNRQIIRLRVFRSSSSQRKMIGTDESTTNTRGRIEYITSCLHYLHSPYFGEFWIDEPIVKQFVHMGSNIP